MALEAGEDRRHIALALERRPGDAADPDAELLADDVRERRLPETGRPDEEHMVERFVARFRSVQRDRELLLQPLLPDELVEPPWPEALLELLFLDRDHGCHDVGHAASFNACRTRSSGGASGSIRASACSASTSDQPSSTSASRATTCGARCPPGATASGMPAVSFSFSSSTIRSAVFLPMPGIA